MFAGTGPRPGALRPGGPSGSTRCDAELQHGHPGIQVVDPGARRQRPPGRRGGLRRVPRRAGRARPGDRQRRAGQGGAGSAPAGSTPTCRPRRRTSSAPSPSARRRCGSSTRPAQGTWWWCPRCRAVRGMPSAHDDVRRDQGRCGRAGRRHPLRRARLADRRHHAVPRLHPLGDERAGGAQGASSWSTPRPGAGRWSTPSSARSTRRSCRAGRGRSTRAVMRYRAAGSRPQADVSRSARSSRPGADVPAAPDDQSRHGWRRGCRSCWSACTGDDDEPAARHHRPSERGGCRAALAEAWSELDPDGFGAATDDPAAPGTPSTAMVDRAVGDRRAGHGRRRPDLLGVVVPADRCTWRSTSRASAPGTTAPT